MCVDLVDRVPELSKQPTHEPRMFFPEEHSRHHHDLLEAAEMRP